MRGEPGRSSIQGNSCPLRAVKWIVSKKTGRRAESLVREHQCWASALPRASLFTSLEMCLRRYRPLREITAEGHTCYFAPVVFAHFHQKLLWLSPAALGAEEVCAHHPFPHLCGALRLASSRWTDTWILDSGLHRAVFLIRSTCITWQGTKRQLCFPSFKKNQL